MAPGFVHAVNPEHGEPVTIQPGELMPDWLLAALISGGSLKVDGPGEFTLLPPKAKR
jgi:hypothetical protein